MKFEDWRPVVRFEGRYEVSSYGRVRSIRHLSFVKSRWGKPFRRFFGGNILKPYYNPYPMVDLYSEEGKKHKRLIHRAVAQAFLPSWNERLDVNHKDSDKLNNDVENLEMVTKRQNTRHFYMNSNSARVRLNPKKVKEIRENSLASIKELAARYGVTKTAIRNVLENRTWFYV